MPVLSTVSGRLLDFKVDFDSNTSLAGSTILQNHLKANASHRGPLLNVGGYPTSEGGGRSRVTIYAMLPSDAEVIKSNTETWALDTGDWTRMTVYGRLEKQYEDGGGFIIDEATVLLSRAVSDGTLNEQVWQLEPVRVACSYDLRSERITIAIPANLDSVENSTTYSHLGIVVTPVGTPVSIDKNGGSLEGLSWNVTKMSRVLHG